MIKTNQPYRGLNIKLYIAHFKKTLEIMNVLKIGIEGDNGEILDYQIDELIIEGLFITRNSSKVRENCKKFKIYVESNSKNGIGVKITKINNISILTLKQSKQNQFQFLVGNDMSVTELNNIPPEDLNEDLKGLIFKAYQLHLFSGFNL